MNILCRKVICLLLITGLITAHEQENKKNLLSKITREQAKYFLIGGFLGTIITYALMRKPAPVLIKKLTAPKTPTGKKKKKKESDSTKKTRISSEKKGNRIIKIRNKGRKIQRDMLPSADTDNQPTDQGPSPAIFSKTEDYPELIINKRWPRNKKGTAIEPFETP